MSYTNFHGENHNNQCVDQILREYFPDYNYKGVFFDIGAYEPINISNSYHFEKNNWDVYCFEANIFLLDELKKYRKNVFNYAIYNENKDFVEFNVVKGIWGGGSETAGLSAITIDENYYNKFKDGIKNITKINVPQKTLDNVIENEIILNREIDIISIDVEGGELKVLYGLNLNKYKPKIIVVENVFNDNEINNYLNNFNYILDKQCEYNQFYKLINYK